MSDGAAVGDNFPAGLSEEEFAATLAAREHYSPAAAERESAIRDGLSDAELALYSNDRLLGMVSTRAYRDTLIWETGGRSYYDRKLSRPTWPRGNSGVTIGAGYDLGYQPRSEISANWRAYLPEAHIARLLACQGQTGEAAGRLIPQLGDILVPWDAAEVVFVRHTLPKYARLVLSSLANAGELHPHAFGALVSLVFNRGPSFAKDGDRYIEMGNIRTHMAARAFDRIPAEIAAMKRLWQGVLPGLVKRREAEAALFQQGLDERPRAVGIDEREMAAARAAEADEDFEEGAARESSAMPLPERYVGPRYVPGDVRWVSDDALSPDYRLATDRRVCGSTFALTAEAVELLIAANRFDPRRNPNRIIFALRGAELAGDGRATGVVTLPLRETRPDHRSLKCVIGVYDRPKGQMAAFPGSTVPNVTAVHRGWHNNATGQPMRGNLLATGCYSYFVGRHGKRQVPGCLIQGTGMAEEQRARVVVLRSLKDVCYDTGDFWHVCRPHDNLHPAFAQQGYSSEGCLTVRGDYLNGAHIGEFAALLDALGENGAAADGSAFDLVLLTGYEAAVASQLVARGIAGNREVAEEHLARLRQGSTGVEVLALQRALRRPESGVWDADDRMALINLQLQKFGWADAVYSPDIDRKLGLDIFAQGRTYQLRAKESAQRPAAEQMTADAADRAVAGARMEALLQSGDDSLLYEVGMRARLASARPETVNVLRLDGAESALAEFSFSDLRVFGSSLYNRVLSLVLPIVCGEGESDRTIRDEVKNAVGGMTGTALNADAALELSRILVARLGIIPVVAQPLAALLISRVFKGGIEHACANWRSENSSTAAPAAAPSTTPVAPAAPREAAVRHVEALLRANEETLLQEVGLRARLAAVRPDTAAALELPHRETAAAEFGFSTLKSLGSSLFGNVQSLVLPIVCGDRAEDQQARDEIKAAVGTATGADLKSDAALALGKVLVARLGLIPAVAQPLAVLLLSRVFTGSVEQVCANWQGGSAKVAPPSVPPAASQPVAIASRPSTPAPSPVSSPAAHTAPAGVLAQPTPVRTAAAGSATTVAAASSAALSASSLAAADSPTSHPDSASSLDDLAERAPIAIDAAEVERLLNAPESQLFAEVGSEWRAQEAARLGVGGPQEAVPESVLGALGMSVFANIERNAYTLVCGDDTGNSEVRQNLWELLGAATSVGNRKDAVSALASLLVSSLGVVPAVAVPVAVLILTRIFSAGLSTACVNWKLRLDRGAPLA